VARVELSAAAAEDLDRLIVTHSLPGSTRARVKASLRQLERFPRLGRELPGRWTDFRLLLGPWPWLLMIYLFLPDEGRVVVVTIQDARSSAAATAER